MSILWGARIDGEVYGSDRDAPWDAGVWNTFESHAGKKVGIVEMGQPWCQFDASALHAARDRDATCLLTMGLPQGTFLTDVINRKWDDQIAAWAQQAHAWGHPFLFRPWWEMNGDWYSWGRDSNYALAWRRLWSIVKPIAPNVKFVWCVYTSADPAPYFPGAGYVDYLGIDGYNQDQENWRTPGHLFTPTLDRLKQIAPGKPVVVCETACTEGVLAYDKAAWITNLLTHYLPKHQLIRAFLWFNWNIFENNVRRDWQIESSPAAQAAFNRGIKSSYFLAGGGSSFG